MFPKNEMRDAVGERAGSPVPAPAMTSSGWGRLRGFAPPGIEAFESRRGAHRRIWLLLSKFQ